jgi:hypothetical protein
MDSEWPEIMDFSIVARIFEVKSGAFVDVK